MNPVNNYATMVQYFVDSSNFYQYYYIYYYDHCYFFYHDVDYDDYDNMMNLMECLIVTAGSMVEDKYLTDTDVEEVQQIAADGSVVVGNVHVLVAVGVVADDDVVNNKQNSFLLIHKFRHDNYCYYQWTGIVVDDAAEDADGGNQFLVDGDVLIHFFSVINLINDYYLNVYDSSLMESQRNQVYQC